jgi:hypothetical protein
VQRAAGKHGLCLVQFQPKLVRPLEGDGKRISLVHRFPWSVDMNSDGSSVGIAIGLPVCGCHGLKHASSRIKAFFRLVDSF